MKNKTLTLISNIIRTNLQVKQIFEVVVNADKTFSVSRVDYKQHEKFVRFFLNASRDHFPSLTKMKKGVEFLSDNFIQDFFPSKETSPANKLFNDDKLKETFSMKGTAYVNVDSEATNAKSTTFSVDNLMSENNVDFLITKDGYISDLNKPSTFFFSKKFYVGVKTFERYDLVDGDYERIFTKQINDYLQRVGTNFEVLPGFSKLVESSNGPALAFFHREKSRIFSSSPQGFIMRKTIITSLENGNSSMSKGEISQLKHEFSQYLFTTFNKLSFNNSLNIRTHGSYLTLSLTDIESKKGVPTKLRVT